MRLAVSVAWALLAQPLLVVCDDLYVRLGLTRNATTKEIRQAYHKKALETHPDKAPMFKKAEAEELFKAAAEAYEILGDHALRTQYDATGDTSGQARPRSYGFENDAPTENPRAGWESFDALSVRLAQERLVRLTSLEALHEHLNVNGDAREPRFGLIGFYTDGDSAVRLQRDLCFPFPFAGWSSPRHAEGFWWEDVVQTFIVRISKDEPGTLALAQVSHRPTITSRLHSILLLRVPTRCAAFSL